MTAIRIEPKAPASSEARQSSMPIDQRIRRFFLYAGSVLLAVMFSSPFVFSVASSLKTVAEIHAFPPTLLPAVAQWENYAAVFSLKGVPFAQFYWNSAFITFTSMFGTIATAAVSAYGFTAKISHAVTDYFGIAGSGTQYYELNYAYEVAAIKGLSLGLHYGITDGKSAASNDKDYSIALSYPVLGFTGSLTYSNGSGSYAGVYEGITAVSLKKTF
jgi:hypothetical protein